MDLENEYFVIGRYPSGHEGVAILTIDDVSYDTPASDVAMLKALTDKYGADSTFFVIPRYGGEDRPLSSNPELIDILKESLSTGDEISLHGYTHYPTSELKGKSYDEQLDIIGKGKMDLELIFGPISGFRPPAFWKNTNTYKALEELGFTYCSSASIFNVFPYNPKDTFHPLIGDGLNIIEIPCFPEDYFWEVTPQNSSLLFFELRTRFESCQKKGTPFIILTHLPRLMMLDDITERHEALEMLERFLEFAQEENIWMPNITDYLGWHTMLDDLEINARESLNELIVSISSEHDIDGMTFFFELPDVIDTIYIYKNGENVFTKLDCNPDEVVII